MLALPLMLASCEELFGEWDRPTPANETTEIPPTPTSRAASEATTEDIGSLIGADGNIYADQAAATAASTTGIAMIAYVGDANGEDAPYNHGLAIGLVDANGGTVDSDGTSCQWKDADTSAGHGVFNASTPESGLQYKNATHNSTTYPAFKAAFENNSLTKPTAHASDWFLPTYWQWDKMINACKNVIGSNGDYTDLRNAFNSRGGRNMPNLVYWMSSEASDTQAYYCSDTFNYTTKTSSGIVRAVIAF